MDKNQRSEKGKTKYGGKYGRGTGTLDGRKVHYEGMGWKYDDTNKPVDGRDWKRIHTTTKKDFADANVNVINQAMANASQNNDNSNTSQGGLGNLFSRKSANNVTGFSVDAPNPFSRYQMGFGTNGLDIYANPDAVSIGLDVNDVINGNTPSALADETGGGAPAPKKVKRVRKTQQQWDSEFQTFMGGLTADQHRWLEQNGLNNAKDLQTYLDTNNYYEGGSNKINIDNKFGKNSKAAWDKFVASGIMGKNRDQEILAEKKKAVEPVVDAPDPFGYKTSNTYEDNNFADKLRGMGIKSNADLINFMHNSGKAGWKGDAWQTQFRSDVDRLLGGDYSDANIRKVFKTSGNWGRGFLGRGDFGDFQNALQTRAGTWNGQYDRRQSEARMDAARQQYAAKQAQQYTAPKLAPLTVEDPSKKYGAVKTGAATLGSAGAGTMGDTSWMKYAAAYGYLPDGVEILEAKSDEVLPGQVKKSVLANDPIYGKWVQ